MQITTMPGIASKIKRDIISRKLFFCESEAMPGLRRHQQAPDINKKGNV